MILNYRFAPEKSYIVLYCMQLSYLASAGQALVGEYHRSAAVGGIGCEYHALRLNAAELCGGEVRNYDDLLADEVFGRVPGSYARYHLTSAVSEETAIVQL